MAHTDGLASSYGSSKSNRQILTSKPVKRDELYYWETAVFKVEDTLFRVPKRCFDVRGSPFPAIFNRAAIRAGVSSGESTIEITDASTEDFRALLRVMYPCKGRPVTTDELVKAMYLSSKWSLGEVRNNIIDKLSPKMPHISIFERIRISRVCKVKSWFTEAYANIVIAPPPLDLTSLAELGIEGTDGNLNHPGEFCTCDTCIPNFAVARQRWAWKEVWRIFGYELWDVSIQSDGSMYDASLLQRFNEAYSSFVQCNRERRGIEGFGPDSFYNRRLDWNTNFTPF